MAVNWDFWKNIYQVKLWEAVALSLGIEPHKLPGYEPKSSAPFIDCPEEITERIYIAQSHFGGGLNATIQPNRPKWDALVELRQFKSWASSLPTKWSFPAEFPETSFVNTDNSAAVTLTKSTEALSQHVRYKRWTPDKVTALREYHRTHGTMKAATYFGISESRVRQILSPSKNLSNPTAHNPFNRNRAPKS